MKLCCILVSLLITPLLFSQAESLDAESIERDIVFIYASGQDGHVDRNRPLGTGFLLAVPKASDRSFYAFLVTARHIVDPQWALCNTPNPQKVFYRINKRLYDPKRDEEGVGYIELPLMRGANRMFSTHVNDDVDVALVQLPPTAFNLNDYDASFVMINLMASDDEIKELSIGDMVASGGLLPGASGRKRNYPLFKFGYVSALPDEDIETPCIPGGPTRPMRLSLVAANLSPGASGSPIIYLPALFGRPDKKIGRGVLVGVQSSSFLLADVAGMTPISYAFAVVEKLHLPDAKLYRGGLTAPPPGPLNVRP